MRRRYRYILLIVLLAAGALVAWRGYFREAHAVSVIEHNGAAIGKPLPNVSVFVPWTGGGEKSFGDQQLLAILPYVGDVDRFVGISVRGSSVSDASMSQLARISDLQTLDVGGTAVTAAGLIQLRTLPNLRTISISPGQFSAAELDRIKHALPSVRIREWEFPGTLTAATRPAA